MSLISFLGWTQTVLFSILILPQLFKTVRVKKVDDISIWTFVIGLIANIVALWYAILIIQPPLIFKYVSGGILCALYIVFFLYYSHKQRKRDNDILDIKLGNGL